ncbi:Hsp33 family molecular chaperone HslO [Qipengyuania sp. JC766]|uniref:Hsp33 family molecular chaperone HslO n=1 Tax=Qipengyuania sp. JC766 TaxID=3232139 RepID=UPI00345AB296
MTETQPTPPAVETYSDRTLTFTIPARHARGRAVRLDTVLSDILGPHDYPPAIAHLLAEAVVLAALMGSLVKEDGAQMTMQAQTKDGIVKLLVCDFRAGELRGYADFDAERLGGLGSNPSLSALFGEGFLAITFDRPEGKGRYQGIVPLEGASLADACAAYFFQSEQVPTLIRTAVRSDGGRVSAAGLLLQHLPEGEEGRERLHVRLDHPEWEHVSILAGTLRHDELLDPALSMEAIVWRLFHEEEEVRIERDALLRRGCRCSVEHYRTVLAGFPEADLAEMRNEEGVIEVDCAFCSRIFPIAA